jgi:hypothetical protein
MFDGSQEAPPARTLPPASQDFTAWHYGRRLFIARSDDAGSMADWRRLFRDAGVDVMTQAYDALLPTLPAAHKVGYLAIKAWIEERFTITPEA